MGAPIPAVARVAGSVVGLALAVIIYTSIF